MFSDPDSDIDGGRGFKRSTSKSFLHSDVSEDEGRLYGLAEEGAFTDGGGHTDGHPSDGGGLTDGGGVPDRRDKGKGGSAHQDVSKPKHSKRKGDRDTRSPRKSFQQNDWAAANRISRGQKIIRFNVGGQVFSTSMQTLLNDPNCLLCLMVRHSDAGGTGDDDEHDAGYDGGHGDAGSDEDEHGGGGISSPRSPRPGSAPIAAASRSLGSTLDKQGAFWLDRDPSCFRFILNFLRDGDVDLPNAPEALAPISREAQFYQVSGLIDLIHSRKGRRRRARLTREAVLTMVNLSSSGLLGGRVGDGDTGPVGVQLPSTNLSGMDLSYLKMPHAALVNSNLSNCTATYTNLQKARLSHATLRGANLSNADLSHAKLDSCNLSGARLIKARMVHVVLKNASLAHADLTRANLQHAVLKGAKLKGTCLAGAVLHGLDLHDFDLTGCNLEGANLEGADLSGCCLRNANMKGANLYDAKLDRADLAGANLQDANLHRASMRGVTGNYSR